LRGVASGKGVHAHTAYETEVAGVPRRGLKPVLERGCRDERIGQADAGFAAHSAGTLGDHAIDADLSQGREELVDDVSR